ncbi:MAG TPA: Wzz/FepE/Etk N-terminal domain-containing protein, partial [Bacteroidales bacterium]|nr:Wzz/FepE/Etk N-terminal domain-containing protein [Bacteroidales bacterium]
MKRAKIPVFNQSFDVRVFIRIFFMSLWLVVLILIASVLAGFLYYRYTLPIYETRSIIQVKEENKTNQFLKLDNEVSQSDLTSVTELIQSKTFLRECFTELPLDISYFKKGTFISSEIYKQSPFTVYVNINNPVIYNTRININFIKDKYQLRYKIGNEDYEYILSPEDWHPIFGGEIFIHYDSPKTIRIEQESDAKSKYFFVINNPGTFLQKISANLIVRVQNDAARTILIMYSDNNALKAAEITNTIAEKFLEYDLSRKKESATNVIKYIDQQLETIYKELDQTEKDLSDFKRENKIPPGLDQYGTNKVTMYTSKVSELEDLQIDIELEIATLEKVKKDISNNPKLNIYELMALVTGSNSERFLTSLLSTLQSLIEEKEELMFDITGNNFRIKKIDEQIESKKQIIIDFINSAILRLEQQKIQYQASISELESGMFSDTSYKEIEFTKLNRLYGINESFYYEMIRTKAEYMISQAGLVSNNIILEKASVPRTQKSPILTTIMLLSIL